MPQNSQSAVTVQYLGAQNAGDLNVIVVGWNDSNARIGSVNDSAGNSYTLAIGPMVTGLVSQAIYYSANIKAASAGSNLVTVSFLAPAAYPDIRIMEYSGISSSAPIDATVGAIGNGTTSSSGALTTTNPTDLLVAANTVTSATAGPDAGYTQRILTSPDGDIAEDRVVTKAGSYAASPPLTGSGSWVLQLLAFRSATSSTSPGPARATLAWDADPSTGNPNTNAAGYHLHIGRVSKTYTQTIDAGPSTTTTVSNLASGSRYYFAVTAYNAAGIDSPTSNEVSLMTP
jgi:hypothetical protein